MRENTDQNNSKYVHFLGSDGSYLKFEQYLCKSAVLKEFFER